MAVRPPPAHESIVRPRQAMHLPRACPMRLDAARCRHITDELCQGTETTCRCEIAYYPGARSPPYVGCSSWLAGALAGERGALSRNSPDSNNKAGRAVGKQTNIPPRPCVVCMLPTKTDGGRLIYELCGLCERADVATALRASSALCIHAGWPRCVAVQTASR